MAEAIQALEVSLDTAKNRLKETRDIALQAETDETVRIPFKIRYEQVQDIFNEFQNIQQQIMTKKIKAKSFDAIEHERARAECDNYYYAIKTSYAKIVRVDNTTVETVSNSSASSNSATREPKSNVKLPKLQLPMFDGTFQMWLSFRDLFHSLVHNNSSLSNMEKFQYLLTSLSVKPKSFIKSIPVAEEHYLMAYNKLMDEYNNKRRLATAYWDQIMAFPKLYNESTGSLKQLINTFDENVESLKLLGFPTDEWNFPLFNILLVKLDTDTRKAFELEFKSVEVPTYSELKNFLLEYSNVLNNSCIKSKRIFNENNQVNSRNIDHKKQVRLAFAAAEPITKCFFCNKQGHQIYHCQDFLNLSPPERHKAIKKGNRCVNCLKAGHNSTTCIFGQCKQCGLRHNTLLHFSSTNSAKNDNRSCVQFSEDRPSFSNYNTSTTSPGTTFTGNVSNITQGGRDTMTHVSSDSVQPDQMAFHSFNNSSIVLLSTAVVNIYDRFGNVHKCRALLDSGSQNNFITQRLAQKLQLPWDTYELSIAGINQKVTQVHHRTEAVLNSRHSTFESTLQFLILPNITNQIPIVSFPIDNLHIKDNILLADPTFNQSGSIDVLLGAGIFYHLLEPKTMTLGKGQPILQKTKLGWIISGLFHPNISPVENNVCAISLNDQLSKFWELEELPAQKRFSREEQYCENYFEATTIRDEKGRFVVRLPFKDCIHKVGNSETIAKKRFKSLEYRFNKNLDLKNAYFEFMHEFIDLGHMGIDESIRPIYFLPHHAVYKDKKIRVVFDASAKPEQGVSLNECLCVGPTIQDNLFDIVLRFRSYKYVLAADIKKMYRQILVNQEDRKYQNVLWRENNTEAIKVFNLKTVTYGTACAPFLAIRCLHEIARQNANIYPVACKTILRDFYVDDLLTGANTLEEARQLKIDLKLLLENYGFDLCKWVSNTPQVNLLASEPEPTDLFKHFYANDTSVKTLGLFWNAKSDSIHYSFNCQSTEYQTNLTKRKILSIVSRIFDPLGLLSPITMRAKVFMQNLWQLKIDWDEAIPTEFISTWQNYVGQLPMISDIAISRKILCDNPTIIELHAFCDASETGYGCCAYLRSKNDQLGSYKIKLICAKSKVAPLKKITTPQLELCGALLLSKLVQQIKSALAINVQRQYYWTDSKIVLAWLKIQPCYLKTFVANRVAQINELTTVTDWYHIDGKSNPADILSRGASPIALNEFSLWWDGPQFLRNEFDPINYQISEPHNEIPEIKQSTFTYLSLANDYSIFDRYSSFFTLKKVTAYLLRFANNCKRNATKRSGPLTIKEINQATTALIKLAQHQEFADEIGSLTHKRPLSHRSKLLQLTPFFDQIGILRVGGRLQSAVVPFNQKHPVILPPKHKITEMIIQDYHLTNLHMGSQSILAIIRLKYWPLSGKQAVKRVLRKCITCYHTKPVPMTQLMGNLPADRVTIARPFQRCGVDYAGPLSIKDSAARKPKIFKAYICLFICFTTKAIHIELVKDLSTDSFINALKRFVARRGKPSDIFSDNGTNFVGANNELKTIYRLLATQNNQNKIISHLQQANIQWHFIPAKAPHMGGLWESSVKLVKNHLNRILGNVLLTFEELYTVLVQIEACLNSRPLTALSNDPSDFLPLTPGHFLIGDSLAALPEEDVTDVKETRLNRFQRQQQVIQHFWQRWSREYLSQLQGRNKWQFLKDNVKIGELVILKEDNVPPRKWPMGRIVELHPGQDGLVRVVSLKMPSGTIIKRSINKVCLLPTEDESTRKPQ